MLESQDRNGKNFVVMCGGKDCCTFITINEENTVISNHQGEEITIPREEWEEITEAVRQGRL